MKTNLSFVKGLFINTIISGRIHARASISILRMPGHPLLERQRSD